MENVLNLEILAVLLLKAADRNAIRPISAAPVGLLGLRHSFDNKLPTASISAHLLLTDFFGEWMRQSVVLGVPPGAVPAPLPSVGSLHALDLCCT